MCAAARGRRGPRRVQGVRGHVAHAFVSASHKSASSKLVDSRNDSCELLLPLRQGAPAHAVDTRGAIALAGRPPSHAILVLRAIMDELRRLHAASRRHLIPISHGASPVPMISLTPTDAVRVWPPFRCAGRARAGNPSFASSWTRPNVDFLLHRLAVTSIHVALMGKKGGHGWHRRPNRGPQQAAPGEGADEAGMEHGVAGDVAGGVAWASLFFAT